MSEAVLLARPSNATDGDLLYIEDGVLKRVGIGTAGQYLKVNSGATGYEFATVSIPAVANSGRTFDPGRYYTGEIVGQDSTVGLANNGTAAIPFGVGKATTFDRIGVEVTTGAAASGRLGIWTDNNGGPGTLILEATGTIDMSTTGGKELTISQQLATGLYWISVTAQGGSPTIRARGPQPNGRLGIASLTAASWESYVYGGHSGALPGSFGSRTTLTNVAHPKIMLRAA